MLGALSPTTCYRYESDGTGWVSPLGDAAERLGLEAVWDFPVAFGAAIAEFSGTCLFESLEPSDRGLTEHGCGYGA